VYNFEIYGILLIYGRELVYMSKKREFEVLESETIDACLNRIKDEGYYPIKRIEKPIFKEVKEGSSVTYEPVSRKIVFEAKKLE
jgi:uncharacterized protein YlbG (UPF0298 family)